MDPADRMVRCVVVQAGARDQYQLPLALHEAGWLDQLVTDFYSPMDRPWCRTLAERFRCAVRLNRRYHQQLPGRKVRIAPGALFASSCASVFGESWNPLKDKCLGRFARRLALKTNAALFSFNYYAGHAFQKEDQELKYRFLFQMHPHPASVRRILNDELERVPAAHNGLAREHELHLPEDQYQNLCEEPQRANGWVAASNYTADTLVEHGIDRKNIHVIPYGVDSSSFRAREEKPSSGQLFTIAFVGSLIQRKGLSYLLEAMRLLKSQSIRLRLCGRGYRDDALLKAYSDIPVQIHWGLPREQLVSLIQGSDVVVLPSLVEGFAHVILETMACGVPVITTPHTCGPDVMEDGRHGFIVPIRDARALAEKLDWGITHRHVLSEMGNAAAHQASKFTWALFRQRVREAYVDLVNSASIN